MIALHLGECDEDKILEMRLPFFNDILAELSVYLNFQSLTSILANPYASEGYKIVQDANPINYKIEDTTKPKRRTTIHDLKACGILD